MLSSSAFKPLEGTSEAQADLATAKSSVWGLWAVVALGAVLRLIAIGHRSFWLDEIASVVIAGLPPRVFWSALWHNEGNMALYYVLLRPWLHFGTNETSVGLLSVVPGVLSIPMTYLLGRHLFGEKSARLATVFFAINACAVMSSQEARGYSLLVLGVIVSTYCFVRLVEEPSYALALGYGVAAGLTFYCHYFGLLVPAAHAVSLVALPANKRPWTQLVMAAAVAGVFAAPVLEMIRIQDVGHLAWVPRPSWLELYHLGAYLAAGSGKSIGAVLLVVELVLIALFLRRFAIRWQTREPSPRFWRNAVVVSCLLTPFALVLLASLARPVFHHRFLIVCLPAWVLMTAAAVEEIRSRNWRLGTIAAICVLSLASVVMAYMRVQEDWRGVVQYLMAEASPPDRILYYQSGGYFAAENYRNWIPGGAAKRPVGIIVDPHNSGWEAQLNGAPRIWLVLYRAKSDDPAVRVIDKELGGEFAMERQKAFRAVTVIEYRNTR
ncbi:MAG: glycosyltransferase family 39 protein [Acidobacteriota bacterium]|nr:glycosyltransferase family 39 protein [Acidobacteriota bacterium]